MASVGYRRLGPHQAFSGSLYISDGTIEYSNLISVMIAVIPDMNVGCVLHCLLSHSHRPGLS